MSYKIVISIKGNRLISKKRTALFKELEKIEIQVEKAKKELLKNIKQLGGALSGY